MRRICIILLVALAGNVFLRAQTDAAATTPPPQSARQALIEMFISNSPGAFERHLPDAAHKALVRKGDTPETSPVLKISTIGRQMVAQGEHIETFETGPNLLVTEDRGGHERFEVVVEHDSLIGEEDEIELSVHYYKDGQLQSLPVVPRITFSLKQEKEIWKLTEITVAAHLPLTDPEYLKAAHQLQNESNESQAQARTGIIAAAETGYAAKHPDRGYTCALATLFAQDPAAAPGEGGGFDPGQANEEWNGYRFTLAGCSGTPASKYRLTAVPSDPDSDMKAYCIDESGTVKFVAAAKSSSCLSRGQAANKDSATTED